MAITVTEDAIGLFFLLKLCVCRKELQLFGWATPVIDASYENQACGVLLVPASVVACDGWVSAIPQNAEPLKYFASLRKLVAEA